MSYTKDINWLIEAWLEELKEVLQMMTLQQYTSSWNESPEKQFEGFLWWEQPLNIAPESPILIGAPALAWSELGTRTLQAAGIDLVELANAKSTYLEIIQQSLGGMARAVTNRIGRTVECRKGSEAASVTPENNAISVKLSSGALELPPIIFSLPLSLCRVLNGSEERPAVPVPSVTPTAAEAVLPARESFRSMDLLLDIEMPVSISFGKSEMSLKDVLKLSTGSVVELDRQPDEHVEIVVNNCVVARGEVVVIDGNYGVRIQEIISRQQRLELRNAAGPRL
ncbi:MAG: flagellar motor switch protein FliN [Bryobacteraceae bacterium]